MGTALYFPSTPKAVKTTPPELKKRMSVEQSFQIIATNCLEQVRANEVGIVRFHDGECLHQMRVGWRRLRAALGMFKDFLRLPPHLEEELAWIVAQLGPARDWDVLVASTLTRLAKEGKGSAELEQAAGSRCAAMRNHAAESVSSLRYEHLMHALQRWVDQRGWRDMLPSAPRARLRMQITDRAGAILATTRKRLRKRARKLDGATPAQRHRVRIAAKKARYATEFFATLYPGKQVARYVKVLSRLQEALGRLNDAAVAGRLLAQLAEQEAHLGAAAAPIQASLAGMEGEGAKRARKAWKGLARRTAPH